jgi:hypothetical protein
MPDIDFEVIHKGFGFLAAMIHPLNGDSEREGLEPNKVAVEPGTKPDIVP